MVVKLFFCSEIFLLILFLYFLYFCSFHLAFHHLHSWWSLKSASLFFDHYRSSIIAFFFFFFSVIGYTNSSLPCFFISHVDWKHNQLVAYLIVSLYTCFLLFLLCYIHANVVVFIAIFIFILFLSSSANTTNNKQMKRKHRINGISNIGKNKNKSSKIQQQQYESV